MFHVVDHPCVKAKLTILRDRATGSKQFRECVEEITAFIAYEALKNLEVETVPVETPIASATGYRIRNDVVIVPILRAGMGMLDGLLRLVPDAKVGFVGLERDHETKLPHEYYCKLPAAGPDSVAVVVDPMLATGGSASGAIQMLKKRGCTQIKLLCLVAAPEGVERLQAEHPDVEIYAAALDDYLNDHAYIVPGLGDAGDRLFGTK